MNKALIRAAFPKSRKSGRYVTLVRPSGEREKAKEGKKKEEGKKQIQKKYSYRLALDHWHPASRHLS